MRKILFVLVFVLAAFVVVQPSIAVENDSPNNKFGIHLAQPSEEDIKKARELVNSQGGDWGYITLVIQENDRNREKWQSTFDLLREYHLIPIIRLATSPDGEVWRIPTEEDANGWAQFLNSLNWVVKKRYVMLFNEPNQGQEWGGETNPVGYAKVALAFARKLKSTNPDFQLMIAGFDASAPSNPPGLEDERVFLQAVVDTFGADTFNELIDGLSSHSYPNPGFAGPPSGFGKGSVRTYQWELETLKSMGIKDLPVFITETGWDGDALNRNLVAQYLKIAYETVWLPDPRVIAVTPFILNYQGQPFLKFSWLKQGGTDPYPQFGLMQTIQKQKGVPSQTESARLSGDLPKEMTVGSIYRFPVKITNTGQTIWKHEDGYSFHVDGVDSHYYFIPDMPTMKPFQEAQVYVYAQTLEESPGVRSAIISLYKNNNKLMNIRNWSFEIVPQPSLAFGMKLTPSVISDSSDYELQVFDDKDQLLYKQTGVVVKEGRGSIPAIPNVVLNHRYRLVLLRAGFLPRQTMVLFKNGQNEVTFNWLIPLDFNQDGAFDSRDINTIFTPPKDFVRN